MQKSIQIEYLEYAHFSELNSHEIELVVRAFEVADRAYAPYSKFHVGAIALLENGEIVEGNNQENIAYPSGLCAERVALFSAGANFPTTPVALLVIVAKGDLIKPDDCVSPCGSCRQVIAESERRYRKNMKVILVSEGGRTFVFQKGTDLLIFPFGM